MGKGFLQTILVVLLLASMPMTAAGQEPKSTSGEGPTEPAKEDITTLMVLVSRMPAMEQDRRMDTIWESMGKSQTPRSDFLFCTGFAYLGSYKAQDCLGNAYENRRGIQRDLTAAYVWYSIALDNPIANAADKSRIQADRDRAKKALMSGTSASTERELDDLVKARKQFKMECLSEVRNAGM